MSARGAKILVLCANRSCPIKFLARVADVNRGWGRFCSKSCKASEQESRTHQNRDFIRRSMDGPTFNDAHLFSNEEHDCNKGDD